MAACTKALETTELLEHVILHLPVKDLLLSQLVCTEWRDLVLRSVQVQQALFLAPVSDIRIHANGSDFSWIKETNGISPPAKPIINPLISKYTIYKQKEHVVAIAHYGFIDPVSIMIPNQKLAPE